MDFPPNTDFYPVQRNIFSRGLEGILCRLHQTEAAGDLHIGQGDALDGVCPEDLRQFFPVELNIVELWTTDHHSLPLEKILMQGRVGERDSIGDNQKVRILEIGGIDRDQLQLHRPL